MIILEPKILTIPENLIIGFSTRSGGVSSKPFNSLNMSTSRGDDPKNVKKNRSRFLSELDLKESNIAQGMQIGLDGLEYVSGPGLYPNCDAMISKSAGVVLGVLTADCAPIMIWSSEGDLVASVHSGWQGSELNLLGKTITRINNDFSIDSNSLFVAIGPGLSQQNFEVGLEFEQKFPRKYLHKLNNGRFMFDNNGYLRDTALEKGIPENQIEILEYCTYRDHDLFFSHRRDKNQTGRMLSIIGIKD